MYIHHMHFTTHIRNYTTLTLLYLLLGNLTKQLQKKFNAEYNDVAVKDLFSEVTNSNQQPVCTYFAIKDIPHGLLKYLYIMGNKYHSDLFDSCWRKQCKLLNNLSTFKEVHENVCMPVLDECKEILLNLQQKAMTLENVDKYFQKFQQQTDLKSNLNKLCQGIKECFPDTEVLPAKQWVDSVVMHIQEYKRINSYMKAATIILELKESMELTGDFAVINTLAQQVFSSSITHYIC